MENIKRTALIVFSLVILAGCGTQTTSENGVPTPRDARTGKTYKDTNAMLEDIKEQRPQEYQIVYDTIKENENALKSYFEYNANSQDTFPDPVFKDFDGRGISKDAFDQELKKLNMKTDYDSVLPNYYHYISTQSFGEAFKLIDEKSSFAGFYDYKPDVFESKQKQASGLAKVVNIAPLEYKLVDEGGLKYVQVIFKAIGFWISRPLVANPDNVQQQYQQNSSTNTSQLPKPDPEKDKYHKSSPMDWQFHASGQIVMRLFYKNGSWLIHDQI